MAYNYTVTEYNRELMARAHGLLPISLKKSIETCRFIRNMNISSARELLSGIIAEEIPVPFKRYKKGIPHRKVIGPGKFPVNCAKEILNLLNSAIANAEFKGINTLNLVISHISAKNSGIVHHTGRKRARKIKRCYVEIVLSEPLAEKN